MLACLCTLVCLYVCARVCVLLMIPHISELLSFLMVSRQLRTTYGYNVNVTECLVRANWRHAGVLFPHSVTSASSLRTSLTEQQRWSNDGSDGRETSWLQRTISTNHRRRPTSSTSPLRRTSVNPTTAPGPSAPRGDFAIRHRRPSTGANWCAVVEDSTPDAAQWPSVVTVSSTGAAKSNVPDASATTRNTFVDDQWTPPL